MKKNKLVFSLLLIAASFGSGCGRMYQGMYVGTETVMLNGTSTAASQLTLMINPTGGQSLSGTWQSNNTMTGPVTGTFTGVPMGDSIGSMVLTVNSTMNPMMYGGYPQTGIVPQPGLYPNGVVPTGYPNGAYPGMMNQCPGNYTGTLLFNSNNQITGTLTLTATATPGITTMCSGSRTVNANKQQ